MEKIIISDTFLNSQESLSKSEKKIVRQTLTKIQENKLKNSLKVHKLNKIKCDQSFRSIRVNRDLRLIVSESKKGYILLYIDHHDQAYKWAENKRLESNQFGSVYMYDHFEISNFEGQTKNTFQKGVLESREIKVKNLEKMGINATHSKYLLEIYEEDLFIDFISFLPEEIQEVLIDLYTGTINLNEAYTLLEDPALDENNNKMLHKDTKRRFKILEDVSEYDQIIRSYSRADRWSIFLHPTQKFLVEGNFHGSTLVEGGPGTGKTIVGMHRACYLASSVFDKGDKPIYFFTFNRNLAMSVEENIKKLYDLYQIEADRIKVINIDRFIQRNISLPYYEAKKENILFKEIYQNFNFKDKYTYDFLYKEYEMLIKIYGVISKKEYFMIDRTGMGIGLSKKQRSEVWNFFHKFLYNKFNNGIYNFDDRARKFIEKYSDSDPIAQAIIVDEVQDFTPIKLNALLSIVHQGNNNIFLLSDSNQRIYQLNTWKKTFDINIVGRTNYLYLNYRTTREIREYADLQFFYSNLEGAYLSKYKSIMKGPLPIRKEFSNMNYLYEYIIRKISRWGEKINKNEIGILCPKQYIYDMKDYFQGNNIKFRSGTDSSINSEKDFLNLIAIENCKGLEFKRTFLINFMNIKIDLNFNDPNNWHQKLLFKRYEALKYVAITRAKEEVYVLTVEE